MDDLILQLIDAINRNTEAINNLAEMNASRYEQQCNDGSNDDSPNVYLDGTPM